MTNSKRKSLDVKQTVEEQFSQVAANYRSSPVHAAGSDLARMVDAARLKGNEIVLDAGCGAGHAAAAFAPHVKQVIAYDLSDSMLGQVTELANDRALSNIETRRGDVEQLPFEDGSFDLVVTRYSAHHWPRPERALREFHRVLNAERGQLLVSDVVSDDEYTIDTFVQAIELLRDGSHVRDHTPRQWQTMLATAGFRAEVVYQWDLRLDFDSWVGRMATPANAVAMIRSLLDASPQEVRQFLRVGTDYSFTFRGALLCGAHS